MSYNQEGYDSYVPSDYINSIHNSEGENMEEFKGVLEILIPILKFLAISGIMAVVSIFVLIWTAPKNK